MKILSLFLINIVSLFLHWALIGLYVAFSAMKQGDSSFNVSLLWVSMIFPILGLLSLVFYFRFKPKNKLALLGIRLMICEFMLALGFLSFALMAQN